MTQPVNVPNYVVLPAVFPNGTSQTLIQYTDFREASNEAIRLTAAEDAQFFVYTAVYWTDKVADWTDQVVQEIVLPVVLP